jgi:hypothetical protein
MSAPLSAVLKDPGDFHCIVCGAAYQLNARIIRSLMTQKQGSAQLCWICARLRASAHQQETDEGIAARVQEAIDGAK